METQRDGWVVTWLREWRSLSTGVVLSALAAAYLAGLIIVQLHLSSLGVPRVSLIEPGVPGAAMLFLSLFCFTATLPKWLAGSYMMAIVCLSSVPLLLNMPCPPASEWNPLGATVIALLAAAALCLLGRYCFPALRLAFDYALQVFLAGAWLFSQREVNSILLLLGWAILPVLAKRLAWDASPVAEWFTMPAQRLTGLGLAAASLVLFAFYIYPLADAQAGGGAPVTVRITAASDTAGMKPTEARLLHQTSAGIYVGDGEYHEVSFIPLTSIRSLELRSAGLPLPALFPFLLLVVLWLPLSAFIRHYVGDDDLFDTGPAHTRRR